MSKRKHEDIESLDELPQEQEVIQLKRVFFCFGKHGLLDFINFIKSPFCLAIDKLYATFCINTKCNHTETKDDIFYQIPIEHLSIEDVNFFLELTVNEKLDSIPMEEMKVNHLNLLVLCKYFLLDDKKIKAYTNYLNEIATQKGFDFAESALSIFIISEYQKQKINEKIGKLILSTEVYNNCTIDVKLLYLIIHEQSNIIYQQRIMEKQYVANLLEMEKELLDILHPNECILAGGGATKLGCPQSKFTMKSDIDFFLLNGPKQKCILKKLLKILSKDRYIFTNGQSKSVFTAIGSHGKRRIQLIISSHSTATDVINNFDFNVVQAYFDGHLLVQTVGALYDWSNMSISTKLFNKINAKRLYGLYWKGFKLSSELTRFLDNTIRNWNTKEYQDIYENSIPCMVSETVIPFNIQYCNLQKAYGLELFQPNYYDTDDDDDDDKDNDNQNDGDKDKDKLEEFFCFRYENPNNVYVGALDNYGFYCDLNLIKSCGSTKFENFILNTIDVNFALELRCYVSCNKDYKDIVIHNLGCNKLIFFKTELCEELLRKTNLPEAKVENNNNKEIYLKIKADSEFYNNGFRCFSKDLPKDNLVFNAKILLKPYLLTYNTISKNAKLKYEIVQLFYIS